MPWPNFSHLKVHVALGAQLMGDLRQKGDATAHDTHQKDVGGRRFKRDPGKVSFVMEFGSFFVGLFAGS